MPKIKKPLKTIKENSTGKNLKTIDTKTKKVSKNPDLEKLAEKGKLPGYEKVKGGNEKEDYLRSIKDQSKKNNLDLKIKVEKIVKLKKIAKKR